MRHRIIIDTESDMLVKILSEQIDNFNSWNKKGAKMKVTKVLEGDQ